MRRVNTGNASSNANTSAVPLRMPQPQHPIPHHSFAASPPPGSESPQISPEKSRQGSLQQQSNNYQRFSSPPVNVPAANPNPKVDPYQGQNLYGTANPQPAFGNMQGQQQQQMPNQPYGQMPWASAAGQMWGNDATAQMGMQFGKSAVAAGSEYVERNFTRHLPINHLRHSFNVSNLYVLKKLQLVLFPWRHKPWSRLAKRSESTGQAEGYRPPREDINSPDLYIPTMALVTYILLSGIVAGSQSRFGPELLGRAASRSLAIVLLEFLIIKMGTYLLNIGGEGTVVDLVCYSGYKFVGIIVTLTAGLFGLKGWMYWLAFLYLFLGNFFFLLRSLRYVVLPDPSLVNGMNPNSTGNSVSHSQRGNRLKFLFGIATIQSLSMIYLVMV